jgi:hypothetical protein
LPSRRAPPPRSLTRAALNVTRAHSEWKTAACALDELDEAAEAVPQQLAAAETDRSASGAAAGTTPTDTELAFENDTERSYGHGLLQVLHAPGVSTWVSLHHALLCGFGRRADGLVNERCVQCCGAGCG